LESSGASRTKRDKKKAKGKAMMKTKLALAGALILSTASAGLAQSEFAPKPGDRLNDRRAVTFTQRPVAFETNRALRGGQYQVMYAIPDRTTTSSDVGH
jgi:hypothetical protein